MSNHSRHRAALRSALLSAALAFFLSGCKGQPGASGGTGGAGEQEIVIGEYASLTGGTATFGRSSNNAIQMAKDEQNAKGGLLGRQIRIVVEDDASRTEQAASAALKLINQSHVIGVLGEVASSRSLAAAPICQKAKVPMLSPSSTNPKVTKVGDYVFRSCFIDTFQGGVMAKFAREVLKAKRAAVLTDQANDYSKGLTQVFTEDWKKSGGTIVSQASYSEGDKDFRSQLTTLKSSRPDVIFVPGYYTEVGAIANQARTLGITQTLMGCDGWDSPKLFEVGKSAVQGSYYSDHYSSDSKAPATVAFVKAYRARYKETPDALAACAYDAAYIMFDAIKRAGKDGKTLPTGAALRDALAATKGYQGVTGTITMNAGRNASKPATIVKIVGAQASFVRAYDPSQLAR